MKKDRKNKMLVDFCKANVLPPDSLNFSDVVVTLL